MGNINNFQPISQLLLHLPSQGHRKSKMISASRLLVSRGVTPVARRWYTHSTVVTGPPRTKISKPEKGLHALAIFVSGLFFPAWVLMHLKEYRGGIEPSH